jgi:hypothetical protein
MSEEITEHADDCYLIMLVILALQDIAGLYLTHKGKDYTRDEMINAWNTRVYPGDETAEYFILPKPKEKLANEYSAIKCDSKGVPYAAYGFELINDAINRWQDQIDAEMKKKLFEAFRPVCTIEERYTANNAHEVGREFVKLSCGHYVERHSTFCSYCGARVVENGKA